VQRNLTTTLLLAGLTLATLQALSANRQRSSGQRNTHSSFGLFGSGNLKAQVEEGVISPRNVERIAECGTGVRMPVPSE